MSELKQLIDEVVTAPAMGFVVALNEEGMPIISRHFAFKYDRENEVLTLYTYSKDVVNILQAVKSQPKISAVTSVPYNYKTIQYKGDFVHSYEVTDPKVLEYITGINKKQAQIMEGFGVRNIIDSWKYLPCIAIELKVYELFEQTPRPLTGQKIDV